MDVTVLDAAHNIVEEQGLVLLWMDEGVSSHVVCSCRIEVDAYRRFGHMQLEVAPLIFWIRAEDLECLWNGDKLAGISSESLR